MRRLFLLVSAVVLVDTMFFAAVAPLLPHYSHELDLSKTAAGVLTAAYPAGTFAGALPGGWLAARWGVKPTLLLGLALLATTSLIFAFANTVVLLDAARFVQGVGGAFMWAAGMAWLVCASPPERRGEMIGSALGAAIVGVLFGPVLGGAATVVGDEVVFSGVSVAAIGLACWAWTIPGAPPEPSPGWPAVARALRRPDLLAGFWLFTLPAIFAGTLEVLVPLRLDHLGASGAAVGAVFLVAAGFEAMVSPVAGRLSDRRGRLAPIRAGLAGAVVMAVLLPLPEMVILLAAVLVVTVCCLGGFWAPGMALLSDSAEDAGLDQALAFSIANLAWAFGHVMGGGAGGALADATADALVYGLLGAACALTLAWLLTASRSLARAPSRSGGTA
jgi:MFS family permease